jgi:hypothetical protein
MAECQSCGAKIEFGLYACNYCGSLVSSQHDKERNGNAQDPLTDRIAKIEAKLDELLSIKPLPYFQVSGTIFRWLVYLMTLGIAAFFWKKKKGFDQEKFNELKSQIEREISIIESGSRSSNEISQRLLVFKSELKRITTRLLYSRAVDGAIITLVIIRFIYVNA